jgi:glycine/D-amino acid oxidase-like deaminating enzyme
MASWNAIVVGGGFFGCSIAAHLARSGNRVLLVEAEKDLMTRASYNNQARVHGGYHYPRSFLTANRSRVGLKLFAERYPDCVISSFTKIYAIARNFSLVNAQQFWEFCRQIQAPIRPAEPKIEKRFDPKMVEGVFEVEEYAFDSLKLGQIAKREMEEAGVEVWLKSRLDFLRFLPRGSVFARVAREGQEAELEAGSAWLCAYSGMNEILRRSNLPTIPLKLQLTEMALVDIPDELRGYAVTVMDGPFFSLMPFPATPYYTLSHVRYTPHYEWNDGGPGDPIVDVKLLERKTAFERMRKDAQRFLPVFRDLDYQLSLWEVKALLPRSSDNDSRPILFKSHHGIPNLYCVLGGKIDNIFDIFDELRKSTT